MFSVFCQRMQRPLHLGFLIFLLSFESQASILPPNDLHLTHPVSLSESNISESEYHRLLDEAYVKTSPWVKSHGAELEIERLWSDSKVNASAGQRGPKWTISMYGGLARRPEVTADAFIMIYCHELGHHLGGFPFFEDTAIAGMSIEGQADYYSSAVCTRLLWGQDHKKNAEAEATVHPIAKSKCNSNWSKSKDRHLCYRIMNATKSIMNLYDFYDPNDPGRFENEDTSSVEQTSAAHPKHQCRLDTFVSAAMCPVRSNPHIIPGKDISYAANSRKAELAATSESCMQSENRETGYRPRCWFAPKVDLPVGIHKISLAEAQGNGDGIPAPGETFRVVTEVFNYSNTPIASLTTTQKIFNPQTTIVSGDPTITLSNLAARSSEKSQTLLVEFSDKMSCGEKVATELTLQSNQTNEKSRHSFELGKVRRYKSFNNPRRKKIPDLNRFGQTARSYITVDTLDEGNFNRLYINVEVNHQNSMDLAGSITTPSGRTYPVFLKRQLENKNREQEFVVELDTPEGNGNYQLQIRDLIPRNQGWLNYWSMTFGRSECH